jgi:transposase-like protein
VGKATTVRCPNCGSDGLRRREPHAKTGVGEWVCETCQHGFVELNGELHPQPDDNG